VLGESAALGDPEPAYGLPRVLEVLLSRRLPGRRIEVVTAAMTAINSHALREIARDCVPLQADAWVVYAGNNEVVGPYGPGTVLRPGGSLPLIRAGLALRRTRTGQWLDQLASSLAAGREATGGWAGLELFLSRTVAADDPRLDQVRSHFRANLADLLATARAAGVPVVLATPVSNLRDFAPLGGGSGPSTNKVARLAAANPDPTGPPGEPLTRTPRATTGDAATAFAIGRELLARQRPAAAAARLLAARDLDPLRFRPDRGILQVIRELGGTAPGVRLVDAEARLAESSRDGLPGDDLLWEHVHLRFEGNLQLARWLGDAVVAGLPEPVRAGLRPAWPTSAEVARDLALTDWDRLQVLTQIRARVSRPPFAGQANAAAREAALREQAALLAPARQALQFEAHAAQYRDALARRTNDWKLREQYAELLQSFGDRPGATEAWREVVREMPHHLLARYQLGALLAASPATAAEGEKELRAALAVREEFAEAWAKLGESLGQQQRFSEADRAFARAVEVRPDLTDARVNRSLTRLAAGHTNDALAGLKAAARGDSNSVPAHQQLGRLLGLLRQDGPAAEAYDQVARLRPESFAARIQAADAWQKAGRLDQAAPHLIVALQIDPDHVQTRFRLALQYANAGQNRLAVEQFREVLQRQPQASGAWLNLGLVLLGDQQLPEAVTALEKAVELEPGNAKARDYLRKARALFEKARSGPR
ncbi:MAG: tetratricopeptide repeat protein, partial [Verrucomicrobiota bacterium]